MSYLRGFEDLKPKAVASIDPSRGIVNCIGVDGNTAEMQMYITPQGSIAVRPVEYAPIDQVGEAKPAQGRRHFGVDQI